MMKAKQSKVQKKVAKKAVKKDLEQSLAQKIIEAVIHLGHDAEKIGASLSRTAKDAAAKIIKMIQSESKGKNATDKLINTQVQQTANKRKPQDKAKKNSDTLSKDTYKLVKKAAGKKKAIARSIEVPPIESEARAADLLSKQQNKLKKKVSKRNEKDAVNISEGVHSAASAVTSSGKEITKQKPIVQPIVQQKVSGNSGKTGPARKTPPAAAIKKKVVKTGQTSPRSDKKEKPEA